MKAIFVVDFPPGLHLDMEQMIYQDEGVRRGGWSVVGYVPSAPTCLVQVEASSEQIAAISADSRYLFVEEAKASQEVVDAEAP